MKNGIKNVVWGICGQAIILLLGLIIPRLVISNYGSDTNGVINTVSQVFTYMALLEAGIATSARNALYRPVKNNDKEEISNVMSMAKTYYNRVSVLYAAIVIVLSFVLPIILKTSVNYWVIFCIVLFDGATNVVSFFFIQKWIVFLNVVGKNYVVNIVSAIYKTICSIFKIIMTFLCINVAYIEMGYFVISLIQLCLYYTYMKKKYSWINYSTEYKNNKFPDRNYYVVTEIAWTVFSSTDMIILSVFLSTAFSSVYAVYSMVFLSLNGLLNSAYQSVNYILGQRYTQGIKEYSKVHDAFNSLFMAAITILMSVAYWLIIPFVKLYTKGITDINYVYEWIPLLFCLVQILSWSRYVSGNLSGIAGYAKQTSIVSVVEAAVNIALSLILVRSYGITGVLFATVIALPFKIIYLLFLSEKVIIKRKMYKSICILLSNYLIFGITVVINKYFALSINSFGSLILYGLVLVTIYTVIVFLINCIVNRDLFKSFFKIFNKNK